MPRAIWSGSISFGLVNVPVKLYSAVSQKDVHFNQFDEKSGARIKNKRVSEKTGREVDYDNIVKGYEVSKGKFVMVTPEELEAAEPESTRTIEIEDFVDLDEIDPIYFESTYYLAPANAAAAKPYTLLLKAMEESNKVAIGRFVMRTKQYLAAIRPFDSVLALETMLFADEVVDRKDIGDMPGRKPAVSDKELKMARSLIESLSTKWEPKRYRDTHRDKVLEIIDKKSEGEEIAVTEQPKSEEKVVDLLAALEASLEKAKSAKSKSSATKKKASPRRKSA
jgi:DNA end-binding protein Ku